MRYISIVGLLMVFTAGAFALNVGDLQPGLERYTIDNSGDYLGPWLDIQDYLDDGKVVVTSCWKQS